MLWFLIGVATGYVLGARAGRERYGQIVQTYQRIASSPAVQDAVGTARAKANEALNKRSQADRRTAPHG